MAAPTGILDRSHNGDKPADLEPALFPRVMGFGDDGLDAAASKDSIDESETAGWTKPAVDFMGTMSAGVAGTVFWSLAGRSRVSLPLRLLGSTAMSGVTRTLVQGGLESLLLPESQRNSLKQNFAWGAVDGLAGIAGAAGETTAGEVSLRRLGRTYLGGVSDEMAELAGRKAIQSSLSCKFEYNISRGIAGGAAGGFVWGLPHELYENRKKLDTVDGWLNVTRGLSRDTVFGGLTGGALAELSTAAMNGRDLLGYGKAAISGDKNVTRMSLLHFNDLHSSLVGEVETLPQLSTKIKDLRGVAAAEGRTALLFDAGDNFSGNVAAGFTKTGYVETKAINMMGVDGFVPGNHVADGGGVEAWVSNIQQISKELGRELPAVCANIEAPGHPGFSGPAGEVYRPYRISEIATPTGGKERIGVLGLTTHELADTVPHGQLKYLDAYEQANKWIEHMRKPVSEGGEGLKTIIVNSHLGRSQDIKLAQTVEGISYIISAHSHDAEPVLLWTKNAANGWDVPIMQAGCKAKWLAETNLALRPDGSADKFRSFGKLHPMDRSVPADPTIKNFLDSHLQDLARLERQKYATPVLGEFSLSGIRGQHLRQTELGTLVARSILEGVNEGLPALNAERAAQGLAAIPPMTIMLEHTGGIRAGIEAGQQTRRSLSDVIINSGGPAERKELASAVFSGDELRKILEFGVADLPKPAHLVEKSQGLKGVWQSTRELFLGAPPESMHDYSGNFVQTEGLKYSIDLSKPVGSRVSSLKVSDGAGQFVPISPDAKYNVLCRSHPVEKWNKFGAFGEAMQQAGPDALQAHAQLKPVPISQVDMLEKYLRSRQYLSPSDFVSDNINNLTPRRWNPHVRPQLVPLGTISIESLMEDPRRKSG